MPAAEARFVFTCEHGGHRIPPDFAGLFVGKARWVASHRGWDPGALGVARSLAGSMEAPLVVATVTRLLVDLNRSPENPRVFSEVTRVLPRSQRDALLARYHTPHWDRVREWIPGPRATTTIHIAVHSFTPSLEGVSRPFGVGLLYDPSRPKEKRFAMDLQRALQERLSKPDVRRNAPYRGDSDGLTRALRRVHPESRYLGLELELNQARIATPQARRRLSRILEESLRCAASKGFPA